MTARSNAGIDQNAVKSLLAVSSADGVSIVVVWADPVTHALLVKNVGGGGGGGSGVSPISPTSGLVNGSNQNFVFATLPQVIVSDGGSYRQNEGWTWNAGTSTATMSIAPTYDVYALGGVTPNSPTSGTVNGSTTAFVFTNLPQVIISDGGTYRQGFGWTWNSSTNTATMNIAPTYDLFSF